MGTWSLRVFCKAHLTAHEIPTCFNQTFCSRSVKGVKGFRVYRGLGNPRIPAMLYPSELIQEWVGQVGYYLCSIPPCSKAGFMSRCAYYPAQQGPLPAALKRGALRAKLIPSDRTQVPINALLLHYAVFRRASSHDFSNVSRVSRYPQSSRHPTLVAALQQVQESSEFRGTEIR